MMLAEWIATSGKTGTFGFAQRRHPFVTMLDAALWHEKFGTCAAQERPGRFEIGARSIDWVRALDNARVGDPRQLADYADRLLALANARGGFVFNADVAALSKFVTGIGVAHPIENGFAWHRTLGTPYLPGSGVKGLTLAYARDWCDWEEGVDKKDILREIFGTAIGDETKGQAKGEEEKEFEGAVVFLDAVPVEPPLLTAQILTPHGQGSGAPQDGVDPKPHGFLAVKRGTFRFVLLPTRGPRCCRLQQCRLARDWLKKALEQIGAGAKTKTGYGRFDENFQDILDQPPETLSATTL